MSSMTNGMNQNGGLFAAVWRRPNGLISASRDELRAISSSGDRLGTWSGYVVVAALFVEAICAVSPLTPMQLRLSGFAINAVIALAVWGEIRFHGRSSDAQGVLLERSNAELTAATARVAELTARLEPRHITQEAGDRIVEKIEEFSGTPYDVLLDPVAEPIFRDSITRVLSLGGGWKWMRRYGSGTELMSVGVLPGMAGLQIRVNKSRLAELEPAAKALASALTAEGFTTHIGVEYPDAPNPDALHVVIGRKP